MNPKGDGEKGYAYDAMCIIQEISRTWSRLHDVVASSCEKEMKNSANIHAQLVKIEKIHNGQHTRLQGELLHSCGQTWFLQYEIANHSLPIADLEKKLAALSPRTAKTSDKDVTSRKSLTHTSGQST